MESNHNFKILSEKMVYSRYLKVIDREIEFPTGDLVKYDVVGHKFNDTSIFVCVFPFNTETKTTTIIREYAQGPNTMLYSFPCGHYDVHHHKSFEHAAECELSEESQLKASKMVSLLPPTHPGIIEVKWCLNRFIPFLALDPKKDENPLPKDKEEFIEVVSNLTLSELKEIILRGEMMLHSTQTAYMGIDYLEKNGFLR